MFTCTARPGSPAIDEPAALDYPPSYDPHPEEP